MNRLEEMTADELGMLWANESVTLCRNDVNSMLNLEQQRERILLTPLPGAGIGERASYTIKRLFHGIKRAFINAIYRGKDMHFESHEEYEDWRRKIAYG
jgi:hypothetical protein